MKCAHCATPKAPHRWLPAICADKRKRRSKWLCTPCDLLLNRLVLEFFNYKDAERKMAEYTPTPSPPTRPTAMAKCPHCQTQLQPASYMHDASMTLWFDAVCGSCGYRTESFLTREARGGVVELIDAASDYAHLEACAYDSFAVAAGRKRLIAALAAFSQEKAE